MLDKKMYAYFSDSIFRQWQQSNVPDVTKNVTRETCQCDKKLGVFLWEQ